MWRVLSSKNVFPCRITIIPLPFITRYVNKLSGCLVCIFKQPLSVFKQYFMRTFLSTHIFTNIFKQQFLIFKHMYQTYPIPQIVNELYHKWYYFMRRYHYSFCFHFFSYTRFAFLFSLVNFFFRNFSPVTLHQFIALDWLLNRFNTQYSLLSFTWGWLSLNYKFIWIQ